MEYLINVSARDILSICWQNVKDDGCQRRWTWRSPRAVWRSKTSLVFCSW